MILLLLVAKFIIDPHQTHKLLKYQIPIPKSNPPISPKSHFCSKFLPWIFSFKSTFFYSNLLIKTPSKITFLHSIHSKKKSPLFPHNTLTSPLHTTTICTITKVSISLEQHQETPNTMEKIREASSVLPNLC